MKRILVPTDLSDVSDFALELAGKLARYSGADIHALKVTSAPGDVMFDQDGNLLDCSEYDVEALKADLKEQENKIQEWASAQNIAVIGSAALGKVPEEVSRYAQAKEIDLVVMGTHGASGLKEMLTGSMCEKIIRECEVPVLSLKCDRSDLNIKKIGLVSDFSETHDRHISILKDLQKTFDAELTLVKVNTPKQFETDRQIQQWMSEFIEAHELDVENTRVYCDTEVEIGVKHVVDEEQFDLLVMATHAREGLDHFMNVNITEKVVNHLYYPILVYKI